MSFFIRFHRDYWFLGQSSIKKVLNCFVVAALFILVYDAAYCFQLTLAWDPNSEPDIAGYIIYYGTESETYAQKVDVGNYQGATISDLELNKTYFFAVTAYDLTGNESSFSNEITYHACGCDLNRDGSCDGFDYTIFSRGWNQTDCKAPDAAPCDCDLNADGTCDGFDWEIFIPDWGRTDCQLP
jgi:hypothetical protein